MDSKAKNDAGEVFSGLLMKNQPRVYAYVRSMVFVATDADDILQEVAMVAWKRFEDYDHDRPFDLWLFGIARNLTRSYFRTKKKEAIQFSPATMDLIAEDAIELSRQADQRRIALDVCVEKLSQQDQDLIRLRYGNKGATGRSAAKELGWSESKTSRALSRIYGLLLICIRRQIAEKDVV